MIRIWKLHFWSFPKSKIGSTLNLGISSPNRVNVNAQHKLKWFSKRQTMKQILTEQQHTKWWWGKSYWKIYKPMINCKQPKIWDVGPTNSSQTLQPNKANVKLHLLLRRPELQFVRPEQPAKQKNENETG